MVNSVWGTGAGDSPAAIVDGGVCGTDVAPAAGSCQKPKATIPIIAAAMTILIGRGSALVSEATPSGYIYDAAAVALSRLLLHISSRYRRIVESSLVSDA